MSKKLETLKVNFSSKVDQKVADAKEVKVDQTPKPRPGSFAALISQ